MRRVAISVAPVALEGEEPFGSVIVVNDVTEQYAAQEQLRQSQKMESVGMLAGGIAHDFNNLLTAITGYSTLSLRRLAPDDPVRRNLEEIKKAGDRAAALIRQLLAFSRKQVLQPKVLDLNEVVTGISKMLQRLIGEDIELTLSLKPALGQVLADPGQIEQVIVNLVVNARDAMPQGGKLFIETANVELAVEHTDGHSFDASRHYVVLAITDTGCGIDVETQQHIFEPFFTTKELGKGTGLGLSTVYGIVKQSGGDIRVNSEVGQGTTFRIYLPRTEKEVPALSVSAESGELPTGKETVLLVEDEEMVRRMTSETLQMSGYHVLEADHGSKALAICEQYEGPIHLMLTDVVMPQMSGRELAERLAQSRPKMRVLYMSGYTDDAIVHHGILNKGIAFIEKPFTPDALTRKVREVIDNEG